MDEEWRKVPGFDKYEVSNMGNVRSFTRRSGGRNLATYKQKGGYVLIRLYKSSKEFSRISVHRLVMLTFVGEPKPKEQVAHNNGIPDDNRLENLRYATASENHMDKYKHGTMRIGERHQNSKLTEELVRKLLLDSRSTYALSSEYDVNPSTLNRARSGETWRHVWLDVHGLDEDDWMAERGFVG